VLAAGQGTVLRFADRIETGVPGRLAFDSVPANLRDRPTLSVLLDAAGGKQSVELSYLTSGLSWKADYVANLSTEGKSLDLNGWVTLTNRSGAGFDNAMLQLVAGTVNRVRSPQPQMAYAMAPAAARAKVAEATQEALMDYHLYSFERPTIDRRQPDQAARAAFGQRRAGAPRVPAGRQATGITANATGRSGRS
jgi:hypothetical protein